MGTISMDEGGSFSTPEKPTLREVGRGCGTFEGAVGLPGFSHVRKRLDRARRVSSTPCIAVGWLKGTSDRGYNFNSLACGAFASSSIVYPFLLFPLYLYGCESLCNSVPTGNPIWFMLPYLYAYA